MLTAFIKYKWPKILLIFLTIYALFAGCSKSEPKQSPKATKPKVIEKSVELPKLVTPKPLESLLQPLPALPTPTEALIPGANTPEYVIIQPNEQVTFSSETTASIASISVKEGSSFVKGAILLELDCRLQQAELSKARAQLQQAKMAEQSAIKLKTYGVISDFELTKAVSDAQIATAEVAKLKVTVDKCTIKAPFNGAVAELMVHPLETVKQGDPLLKIVNTENLILEMRVPSAWLAWLHIGTPFYVHINEQNKTVAAKITKINPEIESVSQTIKVVGTVTEPDTTLLPGMSGQATFPDNPNEKPKAQDKKPL